MPLPTILDCPWIDQGKAYAIRGDAKHILEPRDDRVVVANGCLTIEPLLPTLMQAAVGEAFDRGTGWFKKPQTPDHLIARLPWRGGSLVKYPSPLLRGL